MLTKLYIRLLAWRAQARRRLYGPKAATVIRFNTCGMDECESLAVYSVTILIPAIGLMVPNVLVCEGCEDFLALFSRNIGEKLGAESYYRARRFL